MKTLLTPTPLIAYEMEDLSTFSHIDHGNMLWYRDYQNNIRKETRDSFLGYQVVGRVEEGVLDFDCEDLVKESIDLPEYKYGGELHLKETYWDYEYDWYRLSSADESFISLLASHSLSLDKKYLIIKPKN